MKRVGSNPRPTAARPKEVPANPPALQSLKVELDIDTSKIDKSLALAARDARWAKAFNAWMQDFVNNPEKFRSTTADALEFMRQRVAGREPTYGDDCAAVFAAYLDAA